MHRYRLLTLGRVASGAASPGVLRNVQPNWWPAAPFTRDDGTAT
jgi:hypothetical protein